MADAKIRLTQTVTKGGCAAKVAPTVLRELLSKVSFPPRHKELLVGSDTFDDAAVYKVSDELSLVHTLDFFTPIVDTPRIFGRVAAVNALSDVYAMGGIPKTALAILAFPLATMEPSVIQEVMQGACDALSDAGANLVGGHSIDDDTLKFGLSVTGYVSTQRIWSNAGARVGDKLILTKALGTGSLAAGLKRSAYQETDIQDALDSMMQLNNISARLSDADLSSIHAATDITGFGLAGHAYQMAKASNVSFNIDFGSLPLFSKTIESLEKEHLTKAHRTNREYTQSALEFEGLSKIQQLVAFDPQTSGGLLLSVDPAKASALLSRIKKDFERAAIVGDVVEGNSMRLRLRCPGANL